MPVGQVRDVAEVGWRRGGKQRRGGRAVDQFQHPAGGAFFGEQGQLGEGQGEEVMELIEQARALAGDGLQAASDLAEDTQFL